MEYFSIVQNTPEIIVLKVRPLTNFDVAMNPYLGTDYDYISVTKGENHILTVVKKDGKSFSFNWGIGGHTLISEELELLKNKVIRFIHDKTGERLFP